MPEFENLQRFVRPENLPDKVVAIGGGTGIQPVLAGLKRYVHDGLVAVVSPFDDGGGTGEIRTAYDLSAVGDLGACITAMTTADSEVIGLLNHRFPEGNADSKLNVQGQTVRNLLLTAAGQRAGGNLTKAVELVGAVFDVEGKILPASNDVRRLRFVIPNGQVILGEHAAEENNTPSFKGAEVGFSGDHPSLSEEAEEAIKTSDIVIISPGDLYTSIAPVLALRGMKEALKSTNVIMVSNLMNRHRHTYGFTAADYVDEYTRIVGDKFIDRVIYNTAKLDKDALRAQAKLGSHPVKPDVKGLKARGYTVRGFDLLSHDRVVIDPNDAIGHTRSAIVHSAGKVAVAVMSVYLTNGFAKKRPTK